MGLDLNLPSSVKVEEEQDVLGGGGGVVDSGVYQGVIELAYLGKADSGAQNVTIHFKKDADGQVIKNTTYISTGKDSNGNVRYTYNSGDGDKALPGYSQMNSFFLAVTGKGIGAQETSTKTIKIWNFKDKVEKPTEVEVFTDAVNQKIAIGIMKISEEKTTATNEKEANGKTKYVGTGEFRDLNEFAKYFDSSTGLTTAEKAAGIDTPDFLSKWKDKNKGAVRVKKAKNPGPTSNGAVPGAPAASTPASTGAVEDPFGDD